MPPVPDPIETLCALDLGGRGIGRLVVPGAMAAAARSLAQARRVVLVVAGSAKREIVHLALEGPVTEEVPASFLQEHPDVVAEIRKLAMQHQMEFKAPPSQLEIPLRGKAKKMPGKRRQQSGIDLRPLRGDLSKATRFCKPLVRSYGM